jgi:hypothetical protein
MAVVVVLVRVEHRDGMPLIDDQGAVEEFATMLPTKRSAIGLARGARTVFC